MARDATFDAGRDTVSPANATAYFKEAQNWEADRQSRIEKSEKRAWAVAIGSCLLTAVAVGAIIVMLPLKKVVPYVYSVDRQTGQLTIMDAANQRQIASNQDLLDKHFANAYVVSRESYHWRLLQSDFNNTVAFSGPRVAQDYAARFNGAQAVNKVWGPNVEREVTITSIQLAPDQIGKKAVVRYNVQQRDVQTQSLQPLEHYIATLTYEYHPERTGKEQDLIKNPLGFTVTAFRADPEIGGVPGILPGSEVNP
ncbi:virB8 family protein [Asticcacaulis sp. W401b]|uniref:virB8 family protein n=1 Tax=Asticcacaulis sp. W401b TaxID=3388666 RepID=UPI003970CF1A